MLAIVSRTEGSEKLVMREVTYFRGVSWLRGVDLNHRPLGYEPNELPDCSTPHFDHNVCCICGQTTSVGNSPGGSNLVAFGSAGLLIRTRASRWMRPPIRPLLRSRRGTGSSA